MCLHWQSPSPRQETEADAVGFYITFRKSFTESKLRQMQISIGPVHILSVKVSVSAAGTVDESLGQSH